MTRLTLAIAVALIAGAAQAQTTTCGWVGAQWVCNQRPDIYKGLADANAATQRRLQENLQNTMASLRAQREAQAEAVERQRHQLAVAAAQSEVDNFNANLAGLIREGRCADAKDFALARNNLNAAEQVVRICTPPKATVAQ
jgi:hypothetical protein